MKYNLFRQLDPIESSLEEYFEDAFIWGDYPDIKEYCKNSAIRVLDGGDWFDEFSVEEFYMAKGAAIALAWIKEQGLGDDGQLNSALIDWLVNEEEGVPLRSEPNVS